MSATNLSPNRVPYWRNDLRAELNAIANDNLKRIQGLSLSPHVIHVDPPGYVSRENYFLMSPKERRSCRDPYRPGPAMERGRFDELVEHERHFGRISRLTENDRQLSGVELLKDYSWPRCHGCALPFTTILQGDVGERGYWVSRIEDGAELCEACWLTEHYAGDRQKMIQHVLAQDCGGAVMRVSIRIGLRRGWADDTLIFQNIRDYWNSPGLFELLRLHRVSMSESAGVILSMLETLIAEVKADERLRKQQRDARRAAIWREERLSA